MCPQHLGSRKYEDPKSNYWSVFFSITCYIFLALNNFLFSRDFWPFWRENGEASCAGKIHVVDPSDTGRHSLFIDDNIRRRDKDLHIANVIDKTTLNVSYPLFL